MSLADSLEANKPTSKGPRCTVHILMEQLTPADRKALQAALNDASFTTAAICRALRAEGHDFGYTTMARHRKGECKG